jgi:diketogulonate reductase-like aldo/keto reductase
MVDQNWIKTSAGVKMPRIIYGTAWKKDRTADLVVKAIQTGFRGIDTGCQRHRCGRGTGL